MKQIIVAGACLNQTPLSFRSNAQNIIRAIESARKNGVHILCLPELAISGYGCEDAFFGDDVLHRSLNSLEDIRMACKDITVSVGLPLEYENCLHNVVCVIHNQEILGFVAKQELAGDGIYYEPRWFKPWKEKRRVEYSWQGKTYPLGDLLFEIGGVRIGFEICEDAWNGVRPAQRHYLNNVDLILNPSASNFAFGKSHIRERLVTEASRSYNCTYIYSNLLGNEAGRIIFDGEVLVAQGGELLARNRRFSFDDYCVLPVVVDVDRVHVQRKKSFNFEPEYPAHLIQVEKTFNIQLELSPTEIAPYESKEEEFYLAETLALFDYMRKSYSRGFVISLSGGADSSTCAVMCAHALLRAQKELGEETFQERIAYSGIDPKRSPVKQLLTCVYQATQNSSDSTLESARELALGLGGTFHQWNVESIHQQYIQLAEESLQRKLTWETDDLTLQNIQARLRSPGIWMLANIQRGLLITTSNRSEAAVGYATMDGDTSGGLAPLSGIDKASIIDWLKWAEKALDLSSLSYVNALQPTAELRPDTYDQTDEQDLMPYVLLDEIECLAIRDYLSPREVFLSLKHKYPEEMLKQNIRKFFRLWSRNQWKRERYAPSFHLDDKNLDPKTWCRFPILNGGFKEALEEL